MSKELPDNPIPRRARPRLSMRGALVGVAVVALLLSAWSTFLDPVRRWKRAIRDDNEGGRRWEAAERALRGKVPGVDPALALGELAEALGDPSFRVRQTSAMCLGRLGAKGEAAVPALVGALKDGHPWVREAVAAALGQILKESPGHREPAVPALEFALKDGRFGVRMAAALALVGMGDGQATLPVLVEALSRKDLVTRAIAIHAIGQAGPNGRIAVPALLAVAADCAADPDPHMRLRRVEAAQVLARLGEIEAARRMLREAANDEAPLVREEADRIAKDLGPAPAP